MRLTLKEEREARLDALSREIVAEAALELAMSMGAEMVSGSPVAPELREKYAARIVRSLLTREIDLRMEEIKDSVKEEAKAHGCSDWWIHAAIYGA